MKHLETGMSYTDGTPICEHDIMIRSSVSYKAKSTNPILFDYFEDEITDETPKYACLYIKSKAAFCAVKISGIRWSGEDIEMPLHEFLKSGYFSYSMSGYGWNVIKIGTCEDEEYKHVLEHTK